MGWNGSTNVSTISLLIPLYFSTTFPIFTLFPLIMCCNLAGVLVFLRQLPDLFHYKYLTTGYSQSMRGSSVGGRKAQVDLHDMIPKTRPKSSC
ncbi:uncharacterized protein BDR25DRAFT_358639 [Lindgomyces ingoldianus]|uniref:Uncharacterized protein n=1 Tax=Lindgomyces ingoldianus TaxID=673940 RepID=A0ACB6QKX8_9PLEO|nr:uncharacterized protein BDR25DRAFT_358639 [Lindgomyces ingoldianus]KAF2467531.1 hypothetical protein BDR25DRAFT_358639 [Lindgomyces ingoldianus]